jgi:Holliday junction resolvase RusA-like endonuclease
MCVLGVARAPFFIYAYCMNLFFELPDIKPMTLNHAYTISARPGMGVRRFPSKEYKQLESKINLLIRKYKNDIAKFNKKYIPEKHYLCAEYRFYMPILTKKEGKVSQRSVDLSNSVKVIEDIIFKSLNADDCAVINLNVIKVHSEDIRTEISLQIKEVHNLI